MNSLIAALFAAAFVFIQCYISGTRLAYALPAFLVIGVAAVLAIFARVEKHHRVSRFCLASTALCFGYLIARAFLSPVEYLARSDIYTIVACLCVYGITARFVTHHALRMGIIAVMLGLAVAQSMAGAFQYAGRPEWLPFGLVHVPSEFRGRGSFISSIHFAGYLEAIAPFGLAIAFWGSRTGWVRIMAGTIAVLSYFAIGLSGSRGAWLSSAFSLLVFAGISLNASRRVQHERFPAIVYLTILIVFALPAGLYYLMQQSAGVRQRLELLGKISEKKLNEYDIRIYNWQAAVDQWRVDPWIGTGAGTHLYYGRLFRRPQLQPDPIHAHNDYLELLAEYGVAGAAVMAIFLAAHLRSGANGHSRLLDTRRENPYRSSPELALNIGALTAVSAYFAHSVVDFNLHLPGNALLFAFIFGLLANPAPPLPDEDTGEQPPLVWPRWWSRPVVPLFGGLLIAIVAIRLPGEYWASRARISLRDGRLDEAVEQSRRALTFESKNPFLYHDLGLALRRAAGRGATSAAPKLREAEAAFRAGLKLFPQDETLWVRLGETLDALGDYAPARKAYEEAIRLDPNLGLLYGYFARHLQRVGRVDEAREIIDKGHTLATKNLGVFLDEPLPPVEDTTKRRR